ncbi:MAG: FimV/HubP family polar landmark protein [Gammaproteobacteria bacterium]
MPRVRLAAVPLLAGLLPLTAGALGLGEITLRSALNQPFVAEIPVTAATPDELNQLSVQLAPVATFERFGLDRPRFLDDLKFQVQREGSRAVVRVTSDQPVSEPFISLLLDVGWPQGRLLREYTVLLDPPTFAAGPAATPTAAPAPPMAAGPAASAPAIQRAPADRASAEDEPARNAGSANRRSGSVTSGPDGDVYGPVRANETLWGISERLRTASNVSVNQMMVALYRANPEAFAGNINRLRRGAILRVPQGGDMASISNREAISEVLRQDEEWRSATGVPAAAPARLQLVPPSEETSGAGQRPGQPTSQPSSQAPGSPADKAALERDLAEQQRLLSLKDSQLKALQDRVNQLEGKPAASAPTPTETPPAAVGEVPPAEEAPVEAGPGAEPAVAPVDKPEPAKRPAGEKATGGGLLGSLMGLVFNVWFLVSAAAVLLAGLFFVFARRRMAAADGATGRFGSDLRGDKFGGAASTQPLVRRDGYSVEEGAAADRTQGAAPPGRAARDADTETPLERTISTEGAVELDQADVVAEADFHMAYGLYDQAAELLTRALRDSPDRRDLRLKLLEVYFIWENKSAFLKEAQTFQRQLKGAADPDWNKVVIMGKQICPGEELFAGAIGTTGDVGIDLGQADDRVDLSFDEGEADSLDLDLTAARQGPAGDLLDFDLSSANDAGDSSLDDTGLRQTQIAPGSRTVEGPTIEANYGGDFSSTMETPTIESRGVGGSTIRTPTIQAPTIEAPTVETFGGGTLETPTLESAVPGLRPGAVDPRRSGGGDQTEEINLEDLGLDLTGLDEAAGELGTGVHDTLEGSAGRDDDDLVFDIDSTDDDRSDLLQGLDADSTAEMRGMAIDEGTLDLPAFGNAMQKSTAALDLTGDTAEHRAVEDTAEQPRTAGTGLGESSAELSQVDFDIGDDKAEDMEPTSVMTGRRRGPEGPTMTEVGTKLDLARAYVDMGDPDGARSILNEVLEEGDSAQRQEARRLLDDLTD